MKVKYSQNSLPYEVWFYVENSKSQKNYFSWVFTEKVTNGLLMHEVG